MNDKVNEATLIGDRERLREVILRWMGLVGTSGFLEETGRILERGAPEAMPPLTEAQWTYYTTVNALRSALGIEQAERSEPTVELIRLAAATIAEQAKALGKINKRLDEVEDNILTKGNVDALRKALRRFTKRSDADLDTLNANGIADDLLVVLNDPLVTTDKITGHPIGCEAHFAGIRFHCHKTHKREYADQKRTLVTVDVYATTDLDAEAIAALREHAEAGTVAKLRAPTPTGIESWARITTWGKAEKDNEASFTFTLRCGPALGETFIGDGRFDVAEELREYRQVPDPDALKIWLSGLLKLVWAARFPHSDHHTEHPADSANDFASAHRDLSEALDEVFNIDDEDDKIAMGEVLGTMGDLHRDGSGNLVGTIRMGAVQFDPKRGVSIEEAPPHVGLKDLVAKVFRDATEHPVTYAGIDFTYESRTALFVAGGGIVQLITSMTPFPMVLRDRMRTPFPSLLVCRSNDPKKYPELSEFDNAVPMFCFSIGDGRHALLLRIDHGTHGHGSGRPCKVCAAEVDTRDRDGTKVDSLIVDESMPTGAMRTAPPAPLNDTDPRAMVRALIAEHGSYGKPCDHGSIDRFVATTYGFPLHEPTKLTVALNELESQAPTDLKGYGFTDATMLSPVPSNAARSHVATCLAYAGLLHDLRQALQRSLNGLAISARHNAEQSSDMLAYWTAELARMPIPSTST